MKILGISAFYHDSAAALIEDGRIVCAAQEERFSRVKHDERFPINAINFCLEYTGLTLKSIDHIVFYDKPLLKFERLLETYYAFAPKGLTSFWMAIPVWLNEKMFLKRLIRRQLKEIDDTFDTKRKILFTEHHHSHAASTYYASGFDKAAILTIDGVGEWATATLCRATGNEIEVLKELHFPHSVGLLYSAFTYFLGFRVNSGEYKLMGLAPYGVQGSERVDNYRQQILEYLVQVADDGSIFMDQKFFDYSTGLKMVKVKKWESLFGVQRRAPEDEILQQHCDLALAIQEVTEEIVLKMAHQLKEISGEENLCLAGGVALNCVANGKLINEGIYEKVYIQPASGDAGGAIGAALAAYFLLSEDTNRFEGEDIMEGAYLGPEFSSKEARTALRKFEPVYLELDEEILCQQVADFLGKGCVVGWFQGRMEFGPRALGNRSILGDPRNPDMQKKMNLKIKFRESFRPFAPAVKEEAASKFFEINTPSPYMLNVQKVATGIKFEVGEDYQYFDLKKKLYTPRSKLQAITHVDFSARIQTVSKHTNPKFWSLLDSFERLANIPVLVNTSFNVRGEPIVCTPEDAYRCFMRTEMDYLVIGNLLFRKEDQESFIDRTNWKEEFVLD